MTLIDYLLKASSFLERHQVESPRLNAELLLSNLLGISRLEIYTGFDRPLTDAESGRYRELLARRARGCPLQYLTGEAGFRGLTLRVEQGVFIPRPETEVLVEKALEVLPDGDAEVLDLGCGCGNIAVSVAAERPGARVTAVDLVSGAVELTVRNAAACGVPERVTAVQGDLFAPVRQRGAVFDLVLSNPPYVPDGCREDLPPEVVDYEPHLALFAGGEGLDVVIRIIEGAAGCLKPGGWLALELDQSHAGTVASELLAGWEETALFEDLAGRPRVVRSRVPSNRR